jgi:hypothetical protein
MVRGSSDGYAEALSYTCHFNVIDIDRELPPRARRCINGIIHTSILGIAFPFYLVFATVGYLQFGAKVSGDLLTEWMGDGVMTVAQAAVAGVNILKYPLVGFGLKRMIEESLGGWFSRRRRREDRRGERWGQRGSGSIRSGGGDVIVDEGVWRRVGDGDMDDHDEGASDDEVDSAGGAVGAGLAGGAEGWEADEVVEAEEAPRWAVAAALFALHAAAAGCAVALQSLQLALDIIGATCGVFITFILPGWLFFAAFDANAYLDDVSNGEVAGGSSRFGLAWAGRWVHDRHGRLVRRAGRVFSALAVTLIVCGAVTSACGVVGTVMEEFF